MVLSSGALLKVFQTKSSFGDLGTKREAKRAKREAKGSKREPNGAKREPKGAKREPKGAKREAKGPKREPTCSQGATKMHIKIDLRKRSRKVSQKGGRVH